MSIHGAEVTGPLALDRRSLLKTGAAAGVLGVAAPVGFDSFFSPAAACSADDSVVATRLVGDAAGNGPATPAGEAVWRTASTGSAVTSSTFTGTANTRLVLAFAFVWTLPTAPTLTVQIASNAFTSNLTAATPLISPTSTNNPAWTTAGGARNLYMGVYEVLVGTGAAGYQARVSATTANIASFVGHVIQLSVSGPGTVALSGAAMARGGSSMTPKATLANAATPDSGELVFFAAGANLGMGTTGHWSNTQPTTPPASSASFTELADDRLDDGSHEDVSLMTAYSSVSDDSVTAQPAAIGQGWGAVACRVDC